MHIHRWTRGFLLEEKFDSAKLLPYYARKCSCGAVQFHVVSMDGVGIWVDDGLGESVTFIARDHANAQLQHAKNRVHRRMTEAQFCPRCGTPLSKKSDVIKADPYTGNTLAIETTILCPNDHVEHIYTEFM